MVWKNTFERCLRGKINGNVWAIAFESVRDKHRIVFRFWFEGWRWWQDWDSCPPAGKHICQGSLRGICPLDRNIGLWAYRHIIGDRGYDYALRFKKREKIKNEIYGKFGDFRSIKEMKGPRKAVTHKLFGSGLGQCRTTGVGSPGKRFSKDNSMVLPSRRGDRTEDSWGEGENRE